MYEHILKPLLFNLNPEKAHALSMSSLSILHILGIDKLLTNGATHHDPLELFGLPFKNRIGLAAGFDKNGDYLDQLASLGFSHIEAGTVTPRPQPGNPKPRLFRLPGDKALINRMGFNNLGVDHLARNLDKLKSRPAIIGGNIGKNKDTPNEQAVEDYLICMKRLFAHVDYFTVNVSSPNTPGLRELQEKEPLLRLLLTLQEYNHQQNAKPLLLKIAPDLSQGQLADITEVVVKSKLNGVIATNTTIERSKLKTPDSRLREIGNGGLSGRPLLGRSKEVVSWLKNHLPDEVRIIGVGGISTAADYAAMRQAGADLVQIYTGFIYEGTAIVSKLLKKTK